MFQVSVIASNNQPFVGQRIHLDSQRSDVIERFANTFRQLLEIGATAEQIDQILIVKQIQSGTLDPLLGHLAEQRLVARAQVLIQMFKYVENVFSLAAL